MKGSFKTIDITPPIGTPMGGNCREDVSSRGIHDPLQADIVILENGAESVVLIDLDWCEAALDTISGIKKAISKKTGIEYKNICITMSHTHSGPDVSGCFNTTGLSDMSKMYIAATSEKIANATAEALSASEEVFIGFGRACEERLSFNRRVFFKDGSLHMNWEILENPGIGTDELNNPEGPIDSELSVVKFCSREGGLKAILVNFTLHPAILVMEDMLFSKDFIWGLEKRLKEEYGQEVLIYFANGAEGNINHIDMWNREQKRSWYEAERVGTLLAEGVIKLNDKITVKKQDTLGITFEILKVPVRKIPEEQIESAKNLWKDCRGIIPGLTDGLPDEWYAWSVIKLSDDMCKTRELELQVIRIGEAAIATLPGEIFVEYGLEIKSKSPFDFTMLFGLANQSVGYVPTVHAFKNGGYEPKTCEYSALIPEAGDMIIDKLLQMLMEMNC
jgi:hypothetical protein